MYRICANYDVMCFDLADGGLRVVNHEYFETYEEALEFERTQTEYELGVSITPTNYKAEMIMLKNKQSRAKRL